MTTGTIATILYVVVLFGILYLLLIRPQQKRQKKHRKMIEDLKVNDPVVTIGGLYGTIIKINDKTVILRVADGVRLEFQKNAISYVNADEDDDDDDDSDDEE